MADPYTQHTLANGLRIVIEQMPDVRSAAAGFLVDTGARDEQASVAGVSHFLEHMMFKGTAKRGWHDITIAFDRMGSSYNAYTSEDRTIFYGWVRQADIEPQIELLADMMRSRLPEEEFATEKKVVLEEVAMSKDHLEHVAMDFLQERLFAGHPLGWPILGYDKTVGPLTRDQMWSYFQEQYVPGNMMLVVAGAVDAPQILELAEKYCGSWPTGDVPNCRTRPSISPGVDVLQLERFKQQIVALSFGSVSASSPMAESAGALATILGGDNSRFYWNIVQTGLCHLAGAYHMDYSDFGIMLLYGSCQPENAEQLSDALRAEAKRISMEPVQDHEVERVKNRRRTSLAIESEVPYHRLSQLMDDMQYHGGPRTVGQMLAEVDAVTPDTILEYLQQHPIDRNERLASVGPRRWPEQGE